MRFVAHCLQLGGHLAGVARMRPVIPAACCDQDRRIRLAGRRGAPRSVDVIQCTFSLSRSLAVLRIGGTSAFGTPLTDQLPNVVRSISMASILVTRRYGQTLVPSGILTSS
jgi:hypothetical protein